MDASIARTPAHDLLHACPLISKYLLEEKALQKIVLQNNGLASAQHIERPKNITLNFIQIIYSIFRQTQLVYIYIRML